MNNEKHTNSTLVLVTGASHGIGLEVCRQLAQQGMTVLLTARDSAKAQSAAQPLIEQGLGIRTYALDTTQDESVYQLVHAIDSEFGRLDVLVNNAAAFVDWAEKASTADLNASHSVFETNLLAHGVSVRRSCPYYAKVSMVDSSMCPVVLALMVISVWIANECRRGRKLRYIQSCNQRTYNEVRI